MKLSISIPAYNEEARIGRCLESVQREVGRSKCEAEVIVVNNASTDKTKEIASSFSNVRVVDEPRKGLTRARQAGYAASSGELIANVDADTEMPPGWIDTVLKEFSTNQDLVALSGPFTFFDLPPFQRWMTDMWVAVLYPPMQFLVQDVFHVGAIVQGGNFVLRRDALEKIGGFDTTIEFYGEDTDIARRMSKVGRVKYSLRLKMNSSGRRLAHEGLMMTGWRYALNFFATTFSHRPWSETHSDIRIDWRQ